MIHVQKMLINTFYWLNTKNYGVNKYLPVDKLINNLNTYYIINCIKRLSNKFK
jgi:hypothetical protein